MRELHSRMLAALLAGEGLGAIVELAAEEAGVPVAIVLPARGLAEASSEEVALDSLSRTAASRLSPASSTPRHPDVQAEVAIEADGEPIGVAVAIAAARNGSPAVKVDLEEILRTTALAALAELAVADARGQVAADVRGSLLEDLRSRSADAAQTVARAARLGCDLSRGAVALVAEIRSARPHHAAALVTGEHAGAIA